MVADEPSAIASSQRPKRNIIAGSAGGPPAWLMTPAMAQGSVSDCAVALIRSSAGAECRFLPLLPVSFSRHRWTTETKRRIEEQ